MRLAALARQMVERGELVACDEQDALQQAAFFMRESGYQPTQGALLKCTAAERKAWNWAGKALRADMAARTALAILGHMGAAIADVDGGQLLADELALGEAKRVARERSGG